MKYEQILMAMTIFLTLLTSCYLANLLCLFKKRLRSKNLSSFTDGCLPGGHVRVWSLSSISQSCNEQSIFQTLPFRSEGRSNATVLPVWMLREGINWVDHSTGVLWKMPWRQAPTLSSLPSAAYSRVKSKSFSNFLKEILI